MVAKQSLSFGCVCPSFACSSSVRSRDCGRRIVITAVCRNCTSHWIPALFHCQFSNVSPLLQTWTCALFSILRTFDYELGLGLGLGCPRVRFSATSLELGPPNLIIIIRKMDFTGGLAHTYASTRSLSLLASIVVLVFAFNRPIMRLRHYACNLSSPSY